MGKALSLDRTAEKCNHDVGTSGWIFLEWLTLTSVMVLKIVKSKTCNDYGLMNWVIGTFKILH